MRTMLSLRSLLEPRFHLDESPFSCPASHTSNVDADRSSLGAAHDRFRESRGDRRSGHYTDRDSRWGNGSHAGGRQRTCFNRGQQDHFQWQCPKASTPNAASDAIDNDGLLSANDGRNLYRFH